VLPLTVGQPASAGALPQEVPRAADDRVQGIRQKLWALRDPSYHAFVAKLVPTVPPEKIMGVRTPALRQFARELSRADGEPQAAFMEALPHHFLEENGLHAFLIASIADMDRALTCTEAFLPYIDNWATCDSFSPKVFGRNRQQLFPRILNWLQSDHPYTQRFAMGMLMQHFLDEAFTPQLPALVAGVQSDHYYVQMMQAWYFSMALVEQQEATLPWLQEGRLPRFVHNKAIQKAVESHRVAADTKAYLKTLRRRAEGQK
jgi:3-methyladenine DNA glycosylase AlkD